MTAPEPVAAVPSRARTIQLALGHRSLRRALVAYLLFNVTEWAAWIALLVWAYAHGGVAGSSAIALVQLVPASLLATPAARMIGRLPAGRAICLGYLIQAVLLVITGFVLLAEAPFVLVGLAAAATGVAITLTRPIHNTLLPTLADTTRELTAANTGSGTVEALAVFAGPLLSALLIGAWGAGGVLLSLGFLQLAATLLTARLWRRGPGEARSSVAAADRRTRARDVLHHPIARTLVGVVAAEYVLVGMLDILLVALALDALEMPDSGPGVLNAALGVGGLVGAAATVALVGRPRLALAVLLGAVAAGIPTALTGVAQQALVAFVLLVVAGAGKLFTDVGSRTLAQRALPDRMLVSVFGVQEATMMGGLAVGALAAPLLVDAWGLSWAFAAAGLVLPGVALVSLRGLRRADEAADVPSDVFALLRRVPFLAVLPPRIVERLAIDASKDTFAPDAVIVREGDRGDDFYIVVDGSVSVIGAAGRELRRLGPGDWFGELALLRDVARTATVAAVTDVDVVVLDRESFLVAVTGSVQSVAHAETHAQSYEMERPEHS